MLFIAPKCISRQVILNDVHYQKYHHHHHHYHHWQILCQSVAMATRQRQLVLSCAFLKSKWRLIFIGARSCRVEVVLGHPFGIFHPATGFLIAASKALRRSSSGKVLATWLNQYNWFKWVMSHEKNHVLGIALILTNCSPFLNSVPF